MRTIPTIQTKKYGLIPTLPTTVQWLSLAESVLVLWQGTSSYLAGLSVASICQGAAPVRSASNHGCYWFPIFNDAYCLCGSWWPALGLNETCCAIFNAFDSNLRPRRGSSRRNAPWSQQAEKSWQMGTKRQHVSRAIVHVQGNEEKKKQPVVL